jgi:uncharacterized cupredoxin-like copper-binding protein
MRRVLLIVGIVAAGLAASVLVAVAWSPGRRRPPATLACSAPAISGQQVTVTLTDMGHGMMMGAGPMRLLPDRSTVSAGEITLQAVNTGTLAHELVVLPLPPGQFAGARAPGSDGKIDEGGSLGEASKTCAAGAGDGIAPGGVGWVSVHLPMGRYELVCDEPGHYSAGMYAELTVTA